MENKSRIDILNEYIKFECELKGCEPKNTAAMLKINSFLEYRNTRVKQHWYSIITQGKNDKNIAIERNNLDKERREKHNLALESLLGFQLYTKNFGLPPIYEGNLLTPDEIESHESYTYDTRKEMTDWFLGFIQELTDYDTKEIQNPSIKNFYESLQNNVNKFNRDYGVEETLKEDDGNIKLKDEDKNFNYPDF